MTIWFVLVLSPEASFSAWPKVRLLKLRKLIANRIRTILFLVMDVYMGVDLLAEVGVDDRERGLALQILDAC